jgi:hypothetical protein
MINKSSESMEEVSCDGLLLGGTHCCCSQNSGITCQPTCTCRMLLISWVVVHGWT